MADTNSDYITCHNGSITMFNQSSANIQLTDQEAFIGDGSSDRLDLSYMNGIHLTDSSGDFMTLGFGAVIVRDVGGDYIEWDSGLTMVCDGGGSISIDSSETYIGDAFGDYISLEGGNVEMYAGTQVFLSDNTGDTITLDFGVALIDGAGDQLFLNGGYAYIEDSGGDYVQCNNGTITIQTTLGGATSLVLDGGSVVFTNLSLGFYGHTPAAQASTPVTLSDVITILQNLGLCT
jgi:hypothetical protein